MTWFAMPCRNVICFIISQKLLKFEACGRNKACLLLSTKSISLMKWSFKTLFDGLFLTDMKRYDLEIFLQQRNWL